MLYGVLLGCLGPVLTIAAYLSHKSPFVAPVGQSDPLVIVAAYNSWRRILLQSDHLVIVAAYNSWRRILLQGEKCDYSSLSFPEILASSNRFCFPPILNSIVNCMHQEEYRTADADRWLDDLNCPLNKNANSGAVIKSVLCAGFFPNLAAMQEESVKAGHANALNQHAGLASETKPRWSDGRREVFIHPSSINSELKEFQHPYLVFHEKVETSKVSPRYDNDFPIVYSSFRWFYQSSTPARKRDCGRLDEDECSCTDCCAFERASSFTQFACGRVDEFASGKKEVRKMNLSSSGVEELTSHGHIIANIQEHPCGVALGGGNAGNTDLRSCCCALLICTIANNTSDTYMVKIAASFAIGSIALVLAIAEAGAGLLLAESVPLITAIGTSTVVSSLTRFATIATVAAKVAGSAKFESSVLALDVVNFVKENLKIDDEACMHFCFVSLMAKYEIKPYLENGHEELVTIALNHNSSSGDDSAMRPKRDQGDVIQQEEQAVQEDVEEGEEQPAEEENHEEPLEEQPEAEPQLEEQPPPEPQPEEQPQAEPQPEDQPQTKPQPKEHPQAESQPEEQPQAEPQREDQPEPQTEKQPQTELEQPQAQSEEQPQAQSQPEEQAQEESQLEANPEELC
ncbi:hypothetical protein SELMODRAFT_428039 [Selaginella moellendorffii]|uniref:DEAD-box helicase OB fold domain-containing protein n=1 Tax=Selaginella moellendorffii TaxID=88036 RepID=D8T1I1_SELML|nr:hypothetical protein SELMODRAFT_428039 [Selaginella moellendorffii]